MSNYFEREVKRRSFVVARWDFREKEKMEIESEHKKHAGVSVFQIRNYVPVPFFIKPSHLEVKSNRFTIPSLHIMYLYTLYIFFRLRQTYN